MDAILVVLGIIFVIGFTVGLAKWADHRRKEAFCKAATELGLDFFPKGSSQLQSQLAGFKLFNTGRRRTLSKLIQGESDEVAISIFDYRYTTGSGKHSHTYQQTVAVLSSPALRVPEFTLRPEILLDKLGGMIGLRDFDFASHPKFSSMYVLKGANEKRIRTLFKPEVLAYFEQRKAINVEAIAGKLVVFRPRRKIAPAELKNFLSQAYEIYGMIVDNL